MSFRNCVMRHAHNAAYDEGCAILNLSGLTIPCCCFRIGGWHFIIAATQSDGDQRLPSDSLWSARTSRELGHAVPGSVACETAYSFARPTRNILRNAYWLWIGSGQLWCPSRPNGTLEGHNDLA
jgi:hypothetical protein